MSPKWVVLSVILVLVMGKGVNSESEWVEDERSDSYCTEVWPPAPMYGASLWQRPTKPLILISGIAGSMLHSPRGTNPETWRKLWISFRNQNEVALEYMSGVFNGTMVEERYDHKVVARQDGFGLCSIDNLDPDLVIQKSDPYYYHNMILYLISIGYVPGETLFGFPYDWRQSVRNEATLERLHDLIHGLLGNNTEGEEESTTVDLMSHSMGGLLVKAYLDRYIEDSAGVLGKWTAIGTPWRGGGSIAYKAMISGYALDMTTIPIVDWGLTEANAHAVELNWPSAFELMPDVDHDPWWREASLSSPPYIDYQILGQDPVRAQSSSDIKSIIKAVNIANMQVFKPSTPPVPNPVNMLAWNHADETRGKFFNLTSRLEEMRNHHQSPFSSRFTLDITSIEGSMIPTKFSLSFPSPVLAPSQLQTKSPSYTMVPGDGTVPYGSSLSDRLGARHLEYLGLSDHQRLLRTPEVFLAVRHSLGHACLIEGTWKADILNPNGEIFSTQFWSFTDESPMIPLIRNISHSQDTFDTNLPDGTHITGSLDTSCTTFSGTWYTTYRTVGTRILGVQCNPGTRKIVPIDHGKRFSPCVYGDWSHQTHFLSCDEGYTRLGEICIPIPPPPSPPGENGNNNNNNHHTRNVIIIVSAIIGTVILSFAAFLVIRRFACSSSSSSPQSQYRTLSMDDDGDGGSSSLTSLVESDATLFV